MRLLAWSCTVVLAVFISLPFHGVQQRYWHAMLLFLLGFLLLLLLTRRRSAPLVQFRVDWPLWLCVLGLAAGIVAPEDRTVAVARYLELAATLLLLYYIGKELSQRASASAVVCVAFGACSSLVACYAIGYVLLHLDSSLFLRDLVGPEAYLAFQREYRSTFHPTLLSNYLVLASAFALPLIHHQTPLVRRMGQVALTLTVLCLFIPYWRGAVPVFAVMLLAYGLLNRKPQAAFAVAALLGAALFLNVMTPPDLKPIGIRDALVEPRRLIRLQKGWSMFLGSPVVGRGFDHYRRLFDLTPPLPNAPGLETILSIPDLKVADNMYCTLLAETGILGCAGLFTLILALLRRGVTALRDAMSPERRACVVGGLLLLLGLCVSMLSYELFYWHTPFMLLSLICGWLAGLTGLCSARATPLPLEHVNEEQGGRVISRGGSPLASSVMAGWVWAAVGLGGVGLVSVCLPARTLPRPIERYDDWGFRNAAVPAQADVVAFGGLPTYGIWVAQDHAWSQQLGRLSGLTVYNMAVKDYGPVDSLALLRTSLRLRPRLIVQAFYSGLDCYKAYQAVYRRHRQSWLKTGNPQLLERLAVADQADPLAEKIAKLLWLNQPTLRTEVWGLLKRAAQRQRSGYVVVETAQAQTIMTPAYHLVALDLDDPRIQEGFRIALQSIVHAQQQFRVHGVGYLVLLIPTKEFVYQEVVPPAERSAVYAELLQHESSFWQQAKAFFAQRDIAIVDTLPMLQASLRRGEPPYYYTPRVQLNATGQRLIAERLFSTIQAQRLLEPRTGAVEEDTEMAREDVVHDE